jgi:hypothetical protein
VVSSLLRYQVHDARLQVAQRRIARRRRRPWCTSHVLSTLRLILERLEKKGDANRHVPSSGLGLALDCLYLFQNARVVLWRPSGRRGVQREAVRSRADVFGPERVHGQRARWGDDRGARRPEYRTGRAERDAGEQWTAADAEQRDGNRGADSDAVVGGCVAAVGDGVCAYGGEQSVHADGDWRGRAVRVC